jgi:NADPH-dependent 2,4-dienoyl-CoA reductase/sulfur reductase-like enzyme/nitrite reductase/ring-hydroxylating ferredoxin subunit
VTSDQTPAGPDFSKGVALSDLKENVPFLGHVGDEPVILVRRVDEILAAGATCTHYSGPLAEGLVVGGTVRCPWHHACFDLRTGEALRAPALNPIATYDVERKDDRVRVTGKRVPPPPAGRAEAPASVVIVGAGAAGNAAAEMLRRSGHAGEVTLVGAEPTGPVDRPNLSKDYLAGKAPEEWIPLRSDDFYREKGISLRTSARVALLDLGARKAVLEDGFAVPWDALLLATGADPVRLSVPGSDLPHVRTLRTRADSRALINLAGRGRRAVVIGASFIGLEVAASLRERGVEVHVVGRERVLFEHVLGAEIGRLVRSLHESHGVRFHLGETVASISASSVTLSGGGALPADLVAVGIGVRPAVALAEKAGLALDKGILVNERLETSARGVFAAGDAARWPDPRTGEMIRVEHWVVAERMGQAAALAILGRLPRFEDVPFFWSAHYDVTINYVGHAESWDRLDVHGDLAARDATVAYRMGGRTLAVATVGRDRTSLEAEAAFERNDQTALAAFGVSR